jgi:PAS domain S-box-containing protein
MSQEAYALIGLTALVASLLAAMVFAVLRFAAAARDARGHLRASGMETALLSTALEDAIGQLKAQERAMAARAEASERLSSEIVASLTAGLIVTGLEGDIRILNPSSRRLLGVEGDVEGRTVQDVLGPDAPMTDVIMECISSRHPIVRRMVRMTDGRHAATHLGVTVSPLMDEHGAPAGVICLFTDLSEVVELEEQLRLKDTLARLGELTAGLAHEFRNGLATIHGYARLVDLDALPPGQRQRMEAIRHETAALDEVVTNFLAFAKPTELSLASVNLAAVIARVADDVREEAAARGGRVSVSGAYPTIEGDEVLLRQAFSNLARNALEACAGAAAAPDIRFTGHVDRAAGVVRVEVADNGPGIPADQRERIFRPFVTTKRDGTGLGLALVQKIVITHNGRVQVGEEPGGRGGRLLVSLPLRPA